MKQKQIFIWIAALIIGALLGLVQAPWLHQTLGVIATIFTRLFQFIALPTIAITILTTLASMGAQKDTGRIFGLTLTYTLLTTFASALVALGLFTLIAPPSLPAEVLNGLSGSDVSAGTQGSYGDYLMNVVPKNIIQPFAEGNVLSVLLIAAAFGLGLGFMPDSENKQALQRCFLGFQELLFTLIRALIFILPIGILAFASQLTNGLSGSLSLGALGRYTLVVLSSNLTQMFIILPLFLLAHGINPLRTMRGMSPALLVALFTKSSAGTLPVTIEKAEQNVGVDSRISRFVLPICTTINMNGCAAFILITSLYVLQNGGAVFSATDLVLWVLLAVVSAIGNAGVPMGCYFLTLSLVSSTSAPVGIMGIILPIYAIIDMVETAENVWSDSCVCTIINHHFNKRKQ